MFDSNRIPIPIAQRWKWIRFQALPYLFFGFCVVMTGWLWSRHSLTTNAVGEVHGTRVDLTSVIDGRLMKLPSQPLELFSVVKKDDVVAILDEAPIQAEIFALEKQVDLMKAEVVEARESFRLEQADRQQKTDIETREIADSVAKAGIEVGKLKSAVTADQGTLSALAEAYNTLRSAPASTVLKQDLLKAKAEYYLVRERLTGNKAALKAAEEEYQLNLERQKNHKPQPVSGDAEKLIEPKRAAIAVQEALLSQAKAKLENTKIKSPINGVVAAIFCQPGQEVRRGTPLLTIAADEPQFIVTYIRQGRQAVVSPDMAVDIRLRTVPPQILFSQVARVGAQVEMVPPHQLRDPKIQEWGLPVQIPIPDKLPPGVVLQPGELVDIRLIPYKTTKPQSNTIKTVKNDTG